MHEKIDTAIELKSISKSFGGLKALNNVSFSAEKGEIHALVGENGAGKSTLMKILSGAYSKDSGEIFVFGKKVNISSTRDAHKHGVSVIYQEFSLANDLTISENIFLDRLASNKKVINWKKLHENAEHVLKDLGFNFFDVKKPVSSLSVAYQQIVEICKAITRNASIIVFDEPTAVLTENESQKLFNLIRKLKKEGVCIIYISHRLDEIFDLCDRVSVLKDGNYVNTFRVSEIDKNQLVLSMIGRELKEFFPKRQVEMGKEMLKVSNFSKKGEFLNISFSVKSGEIVGFSGLVGSGRTELMLSIYGANIPDAGTIELDGKRVVPKNPKTAVRLGIGMLSEDRKKNGVILTLPIQHNVTLNCMKNFCTSFGSFNFTKEKAFVNTVKDELRIKAYSIEQAVGDLSGGNQQKVSLGKCLAPNCKIVLLDEPTRGVDVGAKIEIYKIINSLAASGIGVVLVSSEMTEIIGMCDRVYVMREGEIAGELEKENLNEHLLIKYSMGVEHDKE